MQHFQYHPLYKDKRIPGWTFSFYSFGKRFEGIYHQDGKIEWISEAPDTGHENNLKRQLHDLMLYHVYDQER